MMSVPIEFSTTFWFIKIACMMPIYAYITFLVTSVMFRKSQGRIWHNAKCQRLVHSDMFIISPSLLYRHILFLMLTNQDDVITTHYNKVSFKPYKHTQPWCHLNLTTWCHYNHDTLQTYTNYVGWLYDGEQSTSRFSQLSREHPMKLPWLEYIPTYIYIHMYIYIYIYRYTYIYIYVL